MTPAPPTRFTLLAKLSDHTDIVAWQEFAKLYEPTIYRFARRRGLQDADARELSQDILMSVAKLAQQNELVNVSSFRGWLATTTRNRIIDRFRKLRGKENFNGIVEFDQQAARSNAEIATSAIEAQWTIELRREMFVQASKIVRNQVQPQHWEAFWLTAIEARPAAEVATLLGLSIGHVYVTRCRIMDKLRKVVERMTLQESQA